MILNLEKKYFVAIAAAAIALALCSLLIPAGG